MLEGAALRNKNSLFFMVIIFFNFHAYAGDHADTFQVFGGHNYCKYWLKSEKENKSSNIDKLAKAAWISGYISAINFYTGYENFKDISIVTVNDYISNFCIKNPQGKKSSAIIDLMAKIKEK